MSDQLPDVHTSAVAARDAAKAAETAATVAQKQLEISERPWVSAEFSIDQPIEFQPNGDMGVRVHVVMRNIGHSVATDVRAVMSADADGGKGEFMKIPKAQKEMCDTWRKLRFGDQFNGSSTTLFPGESISEENSFRFTKEQVEKVQTKIGGKNIITGVLVYGCVDYGFAFASEHHQTGFNYQIIKPGPISPTAKFGEAVGGALFMNVGENIPVSHWKIRRSIFGGFYVD